MRPFCPIARLVKLHAQLYDYVTCTLSADPIYLLSRSTCRKDFKKWWAQFNLQRNLSIYLSIYCLGVHAEKITRNDEHSSTFKEIWSRDQFRYWSTGRVVQSAKILVLPLKCGNFFQYCDSNIGFFSIAPHLVFTLPTLR